MKELIMKEIIEKYTRMRARKEMVLNGMCATCGRTENHIKITKFGQFTHQFDSGIDARMWNEIDFLRQALNQIRQETLEEIKKDMEKEIEAENGRGAYNRSAIRIKYLEEIINLIQAKNDIA